jgi:hypothetical protein
MVTQTDLTDVFGVDVDALFREWIHGEFAAWLQEKFPGKHITLVLLDTAQRIDACEYWFDSQDYQLFVEHVGTDDAQEKAKQSGGTLQNVHRKLRFVLRTGLDSLDAEEEYAHLVLPGDFPWEGAGDHAAQLGGVSGLDKESDWQAFCKCVDKLNELLSAINRAAMAKANELRQLEDSPVEVKYLEGIELTVDEVFPDLVRPGSDDQPEEAGGDGSSTDETASEVAAPEGDTAQ